MQQKCITLLQSRTKIEHNCITFTYRSLVDESEPSNAALCLASTWLNWFSMSIKQSLSGYIREHLSTIEHQIDIGIRHESIVENLQSNGLDVDLGTFRTALYRARKKAQNSTPRPTSTAPAPTAPIKKESKERIEEVTTEDNESGPTHRPTDIDAILKGPQSIGHLTKIGKRGRK